MMLLEHMLNLGVKQKKTMEKEKWSNLDDYQNNKLKVIDEHKRNQLSKLPILKKITEITITDVNLVFDATSMYSSAMWDEKSVYAKIGTANDSTSNMKDENVQKIKTQTFTQGTTILKELYH